MTKLFGVRRDQISSSKPPQLDNMCGQHVVKINVFEHFFTFSQCDWVEFTASVIYHLVVRRSYLVPSYTKQFDHTTITSFGGSRKSFLFAFGVSSQNKHLHIMKLKNYKNVIFKFFSN